MLDSEHLSFVEVEFVLVDDQRGVYVHSKDCGYAVPVGYSIEKKLGKYRLHLPALNRILQNEAIKNGNYTGIRLCGDCITNPRKKFRNR